MSHLFGRQHASSNRGNWGANSLGHEWHSAAGARIDLNQVNLAVFYRELNIHETKNVQTACEQFRLTFDFSDNLRRQAIRRKRTGAIRSEEHTSELQSLMRISYAVFCLKKKKTHYKIHIDLK